MGWRGIGSLARAIAEIGALMGKGIGALGGIGIG